MSETELRKHSRYTWLLVAFSALVILFMAQQSRAQTTNTLVMQDANFATQFNSGGDFFNNGSTELGMWANSGAKQTVGWANFGASGFGGTARNLQVGDVFTITVAATRAFGQIGFSLNNGGTQGTSYANNISGSRLYVNTDNYGSWYVGGLANSATSSFSYSPSQDTYKDYRFKVFITSETTGYVELYVDGTYQSTAYNLTFGGSAGENISALSIYGSDMWDGTSNDNAYWKQTSTIVDNGSVNIGYNLGGSSTFNPGVIADGLVANSATSVRTNSVNIGGDSGSIVILDDSSTYGGSTTVNAAATARAANANAFGTNGVVTVTSGGRIQMSNAVSVSRALVLNGDGITTSGALQNVSGNNTWSGNITNNSNGRINSDTGTLTISGAISNAASQSLYFGGAGNVTVNGAITGNRTTGDGALYKDGTGNLTLSANNTGLTGLLRLKGGTVTVTNGNSFGSGSVEFGSGATLVTLQVNSNTTIANRFELDNNTTNAVINVASGQTATFSGVLSQTNGTVNTNKFGKDGAGTLVFNNGGGTYNGQIQIGQGSVVLGASGALGTNLSTSFRGVDLGLNVGDTSTANDVELRASNNVTVGQSIYVAPNTSSAKRTIGLSGTGTATFSNEIYLDGNLTVDAGSSGTVAITGVLATNYLGAGGGIITTNGTVILSGANTYNGGTTVGNGSTLKIGAGAGTGALGGGNVTNNGTLVFDRTGAISWANLISGTGGLTKTNTGTLTLSGANTYSGDTTIQGGILQVSVTNNLGASNNGVTINNGGTLRATANMTNTRNITITTGNTGYVEAAAGTTNTLNGTLSKNGSVLVLGGGGTHIVNGSITGANANSDLVVSNSTSTINSTNSYNGPTFIVAAGTLNNGATNALPTDTALTLGQAGETSSTTNRYNLNGYSQTVASVATAGSSVNIVTNSTGSGNLTLNSSVDKSISGLTMGGTGLTLTKSGANTVTLATGNTIGPGTIAIQQGTLLLGAANQIGDSTAITLSGGKLSTAGYQDAVGKLTVTANSTIQGMNSTSGSAFTFSDIDLGNYSTSSGSTLTFLNSSGTSYALGTVIQLSTLAASSWTGYSETSLNNFSSKISFSDANLRAQINFGGGTSGTTLTVAAIPEPKVYMAAAGLVVLIALAEVRRRSKLVSSKA